MLAAISPSDHPNLQRLCRPISTRRSAWQAASSAPAVHAPSSSPRASSSKAHMSLIEYDKIARSGRKQPIPSTTLPVVEETGASGEVAALYQHFRTHFGRPDVPGILKCFATHPPLLRHMMDLAETLIFAEGALTRRQKEMIATLV